MGTKVLFHYDVGDRLRKTVAQFGSRGLQVVCCPEGSDEPFYSELSDAHSIWHVLRPITADDMARAPKLRLIQKIGVGVNTIDLEAAKARGIAVCNMPGTNSRAVAEMSLLLMLAALRRQPRLDRACRRTTHQHGRLNFHVGCDDFPCSGLRDRRPWLNIELKRIYSVKIN